VDLTTPLSTVLAPTRHWPTSEVVLALLVGGVAVRGAWLTLGVFSLRRLRRTAARLDPPPPGFRDAEDKVGVRADVYVNQACASNSAT
jgi:hypothetical protein